MADEITIFGHQNQPDSGDEVLLELPDAGLTLDTWTSYRVDADFLNVSDSFSFTVAMDVVPGALRDALVPGAAATLRVNTDLQMSGFIDDVSYTNSRGGGTEIHISGRDSLSPLVDTCIDPTLRFNDGMTLGELLKTIFIDLYGFLYIDPSNEENRDVLTGEGILENQTRGVRTTKKGRQIKSVKLHRCQPYPGEGAFAFASRISQRHGFWIWPAADGKGIIVGTPDFDQSAKCRLVRRQDSPEANNIQEGGAHRSAKDQPSIIVATGFGGGADFVHTNLKAAMINEVTGLDDQDFPTDYVSKVLLNYPDATQITPVSHLNRKYRFARNLSRALYLHDDESKTHEHLEFYVRREMALRQRHAITAEYTVKGHTTPGDGRSRIPWTIDTIVDVQDDRSDFYGPMWLGRRTLTKSRQGTQTHLSLILPHTMSFS